MRSVSIFLNLFREKICPTWKSLTTSWLRWKKKKNLYMIWIKLIYPRKTVLQGDKKETKFSSQCEPIRSFNCTSEFCMISQCEIRRRIGKCGERLNEKKKKKRKREKKSPRSARASHIYFVLDANILLFYKFFFFFF